MAESLPTSSEVKDNAILKIKTELLLTKLELNYTYPKLDMNYTQSVTDAANQITATYDSHMTSLVFSFGNEKRTFTFDEHGSGAMDDVLCLVQRLAKAFGIPMVAVEED